MRPPASKEALGFVVFFLAATPINIDRGSPSFKPCQRIVSGLQIENTLDQESGLSTSLEPDHVAGVPDADDRGAKHLHPTGVVPREGHLIPKIADVEHVNRKGERLLAEGGINSIQQLQVVARVGGSHSNQ